MKPSIKYFLSGFVVACIVGIGSMIGFSLFYNDRDMSFHEQTMPSGKPVRITMCSLASGGEHNDRYPDEDCFTIEYVMSSPEAAQDAKDREAMEVFELIRPISEEWKITKAEVIAFPTLKRKGIYYVYSLNLTTAGKWDYRRDSAKVHSND